MIAALYGILWVLARIIGWVCFRYRTVGRVPQRGGFLIASNHASYIDIPLLGCGILRRIWYIGRHDLFPVPLLNGLLQALGWIPLRIGRLDREAFTKAVSLIKEGKPVAIFPEGGAYSDGLVEARQARHWHDCGPDRLSGRPGSHCGNVQGVAAGSQVAPVSSRYRDLWSAD